MKLWILTPFLLSFAALAQDCPRAEQILRVQEHEAMVRRAQRREIVPPRAVPVVAVDRRTPEQREADSAILAAFMKHEPTGKLIAVAFTDGTVLYVPEVK